MMLYVHEAGRKGLRRREMSLVIFLLGAVIGGFLMINPALSGVVMDSGGNSMSLDNYGERPENSGSLLSTPPPNPRNDNWDYYEMGLPWGIVPEVHVPWYPPGNKPRPPYWGQKPPGYPSPGTGWRPPPGQQKPSWGPGSSWRPPQWGHKPPGYSPGGHRPDWRPPRGAQRPPEYPHSSRPPGWQSPRPQGRPPEHRHSTRPAPRPGNPHQTGSGKEMTRGQ